MASKSYLYNVYPSGFDIGGSVQYPDNPNVIYVVWGVHSVQSCADCCTAGGNACAGSTYFPAYGACYLFAQVSDCGYPRSYPVYSIVRA